jgi:hypothetical protein
VLHCDAPLFERPLAEPMADLIVSLMGNYDAMVAPATTSGKNISPRVAALLDEMQVSGITAVKSTLTRLSARSMPATPSRRCRPPVRRRSSRCSLPRSRQPVPVVRLQSKRSMHRLTPA